VRPNRAARLLVLSSTGDLTVLMVQPAHARQ
jgi:hypothetical protein